MGLQEMRSSSFQATHNGEMPSAETSLHIWNGSITAKASLDQQCYAPGDRLILMLAVEKRKRRSVPVVLASLNLVARAQAFPLRSLQKNKPTTHKTKFSKKCL